MPLLLAAAITMIFMIVWGIVEFFLWLRNKPPKDAKVVWERVY